MVSYFYVVMILWCYGYVWWTYDVMDMIQLAYGKMHKRCNSGFNIWCNCVISVWFDRWMGWCESVWWVYCATVFGDGYSI